MHNLSKQKRILHWTVKVHVGSIEENLIRLEDLVDRRIDQGDGRNAIPGHVRRNDREHRGVVRTVLNTHQVLVSRECGTASIQSIKPTELRGWNSIFCTTLPEPTCQVLEFLGGGVHDNLLTQMEKIKFCSKK